MNTPHPTPDAGTSTPRPSPVGRRAFLRGATAVGAAGAGAAAFGVADAMTATAAPASGRRVPFEGVHQAGIVTPQQQAATFVSLQAIAPDRAALREMFRTLTDRARFLTAGGPAPAGDVAAVPSDSATLGPVVPSDGLTVTVGVGASLFDHRYGLADRRPARLTAMPVFPDDHTDGSAELHGDISLQICADSRDTVMHALRDITRHTRSGMQPVWKADGFRAAPRPSGTPRNQLGFKDGTGNPDVADPATADALIWTRGAADGEPAWADGGSYQVIRIIRMLVEFWDRVSLQEQETMIGRRRDSGAPLDGTAESDVPDYAADPRGQVTSLDAHIRLANPRTARSAAGRMLRRGYNYDRGLDLNGDLDVGLLFCCYQRDVARQFQAAQERLAGEPLVDYVRPTGGGYFFALPGVRGPGDHLAAALLA
ncbi:iron uptake transporter deferrochelatase/peroxidase subunit [Streptantibioticus silvisoli]|uniref:Deferrochelatase n=1 Tax=Streptantibioticus silvisoli TaxID=2705255 RepID=A0ABT6VUI4_9ACTN|nr:iron uptake transporter deferrochelatase/peroxidase subunit [Streptantibioticus silvisoli]MDI5961729.1 iron uptake transporter deferrochelatase/peroxidase subunit [Streptantibioticus silvisoli]